MRDGLLLFYGALAAVFCLSVMVTHCTYQEADCRKEAIRNKVTAEQIDAICKIGR